MADHLSDEEQLEAFKKWWQRYGTLVLFTLVLAGGGWYGWDFWQKKKQSEAEQASIVFMAMLDAVGAWEKDGTEENASVVASHAESLKKLDSDSQYARYGALTVAKLAAADGDYDNAVAELNWVLASAQDEPMKALVRLRLASVEFARKNEAEALKLLDEPHPEAFSALYEELKGDILAAGGDNERAREAYEAALKKLDKAESQSQALLELKLNEVMPLAVKNNAVEDA